MIKYKECKFNFPVFEKQKDGFKKIVKHECHCDSPRLDGTKAIWPILPQDYREQELGCGKGVKFQSKRKGLNYGNRI